MEIEIPSTVGHDHQRPQRDHNAMVRVFIISVSTILIVTGLGKIFAAWGSAKALLVVDPIIGIKFKYLLAIIGVIELVIALFCVFSKSVKKALVLLAVLSVNLLVYRLALVLIGWHKPCTCLGTFTDSLHISPGVADNIMKIVLAYILAGSLFCLGLGRRRGAASAL